MKLPVRKGIYIGFCVAMLAIATVSVLGYYHESHEDILVQKAIKQVEILSLTHEARDKVQQAAPSETKVDLVKIEKELAPLMTRLDAIVVDDKQKEMVAAFRTSWDDYRKQGVAKAPDQAFMTAVGALSRLDDASAEQMKASMAEMSGANVTMRTVFIFTVTGLLLVMGLALMITLRIYREIKEVTSVGELMAAGDFSQRVALEGGNYLGQLKGALNQLQANLIRHMMAVAERGRAVDYGSSQLFEANDDFA